MSLYDYRKAMELQREDITFRTLMMAAMLRSEGPHVELLRNVWPEVWAEVEKRFNEGDATGRLPEDVP